MKHSDGVALSIAFSLPVLTVQFASLQIVAYSVLLGLMILTFVLNVARRGSVNGALFFAACLFLLFILFQIRSDVFMVWGVMDAAFLIPVCAVLLAASTLPRTNSRRLYEIIYLSSACICFVWIALHVMGVFPPFLIFPPYAGTRWVGGFDGPNEFGQFYVLTMALGFGLYLEGKIKLLPLVVCSAVFAFCVWNSFSRGALIAAAILGVVVAFLSIFGRKRWRLLFVAVGVLAISSVYFERFASAFLDVRKARSGRDDLLQTAIESFERSPLVGRGFGYFDSIAGLPPHSDYLYFAVSAGIIGLVILLSSYAYLTWGSYRRGMYVEFLFFIVFAVHSLSFNNLVRGRLSILFWVVACVALVKFVRSNQFDIAAARVRYSAGSLRRHGDIG